MNEREPHSGVWDLTALVGGATDSGSDAAAPTADASSGANPRETEQPSWSPPAQWQPDRVASHSGPANDPPAASPAPILQPESSPTSGVAPPPGPGRTSNRRLVVAIAAMAFVVLVAVSLAVVVPRLGDKQAGTVAQPGTGGQAANAGTGAPAPDVTTDSTTEPTADATTPTTEPTEAAPSVDPQEAALAELDRIYRGDRETVTFHGQYAAQIASKFPGITDPLQTTETGSHTFQAADILAEHRRLRSEHDSRRHPVVLLQSTDYGKHQLVGGQLLWVTFAVGSFPDRRSVTDWCDTEFADLSAAERENQCVPRRLEP